MKEALSSNSEVRLNYIDIFENPMNMKKFLKLRDTAPEFAEARELHYVGIPCILYENKIFLPDSPEEALKSIGE